MKIKFIYLALIILCYSTINLKSQTTSMWSGSGIVLSTDGYIATNNHVVESGLEFFVDVFTNGIKKTYKANVIKTDAENDLAVIKIVDPAFKNFSALPYSMKMQGINVGEKVFAMGYPQVGVQGEEVKVTDGIISSKTGFQNDNKTYQISAPIQHGNSGGPLFDNSGNLIGLTSSGLPTSQNVGWAIKISYLNNLLDLVSNFPPLPVKTTITELAFTEKIKVLSNFTVLIRVTKPDCDLEFANSFVNNPQFGLTYNQVCEYFKKPATKNLSSTSTTDLYEWIFCEDNNTYVNCWFNNGKLYMLQKTFRGKECCSNITDENFQIIKKGGMNYEAVCHLLGNKGDIITISSGGATSMIKWYDCKDESLFFTVWFNNWKFTMVSKGEMSAPPPR